MVSPNQVEKIKLYTTNLKDSGVGPETTKKLRVKYRQWWFYTTSYLVSLFHCSISMWYNTTCFSGWLAGKFNLTVFFKSVDTEQHTQKLL